MIANLVQSNGKNKQQRLFKDPIFSYHVSN